jgi:hypothetical protein
MKVTMTAKGHMVISMDQFEGERFWELVYRTQSVLKTDRFPEQGLVSIVDAILDCPVDDPRPTTKKKTKAKRKAK